MDTTSENQRRKRYGVIDFPKLGGGERPRMWTVWFRPPTESATYGMGRVAVFVQAKTQPEAIKVALASGLYSYVEQRNALAFVYDGCEEGVPSDLIR